VNAQTEVFWVVTPFRISEKMLLPPSKATLKMGLPSETFVSTYNTKWCDNPEGHNMAAVSYKPVSIPQITKFKIIHNTVVNP
jgi:hypothetical protein